MLQQNTSANCNNNKNTDSIAKVSTRSCKQKSLQGWELGLGFTNEKLKFQCFFQGFSDVAKVQKKTYSQIWLNTTYESRKKRIFLYSWLPSGDFIFIFSFEIWWIWAIFFSMKILCNGENRIFQAKILQTFSNRNDIITLTWIIHLFEKYLFCSIIYLFIYLFIPECGAWRVFFFFFLNFVM